MKTPNCRTRLLACAIALSLSSQALAQSLPSLPDPRPAPKRPSNIKPPPKQPEREYVQTGVDFRANTSRRVRFDIRAVKLHEVELADARMRGKMLRADNLALSVVVMNTGSQTFAFSGNHIDASIIEGYFDYRQRVNIDRRQVPYYPARGEFDIAVRVGDAIELPIVIRGQKRNKVGLWPVPSPFQRGPGLRAVRLQSGNAPIEIRPDVWYTIDAALTPADDDEIADEHSVFINVRFDRSGRIAEQQGPYLH